MRSFSLFALAAAAFAPFVAAAPAPVPVSDLVARCNCKSVPTILVGLQADLQVNLDLLTSITKDNCTSAVITPILTDVVSIFGGVVVDLQALVNVDINVILASVDGTAVVAVSVVAGLVAEILIALCGALSVVLSVVADVSVLVDIIVAVKLDVCIVAFINILVQLVAGLLIELTPLCGAIVQVLLSLNLSVVLNVLALVSL